MLHELHLKGLNASRRLQPRNTTTGANSAEEEAHDNSSSNGGHLEDTNQDALGANGGSPQTAHRSSQPARSRKGRNGNRNMASNVFLVIIGAVVYSTIFSVTSRLSSTSSMPSVSLTMTMDGAPMMDKAGGIKIHKSISKTLDSEHFLMDLDKKRTYTGDCKNKYLSNHTWGKLVAPFVDKLEAKNIVARMAIPNLLIVPTIAYFNEHNASNFTPPFFRALDENGGAVIKPTHYSGGVAQVYHNLYHCFKKCAKKQVDKMPVHNNDYTYLVARTTMSTDLQSLYRKAEMETQYQYIPRGIIVEPRLPVEDMMEYHWWVVNGHPVFVCLRCNDPATGPAGSYFSMRFKRLNIKMEGLPHCRADLEPPKTWSKMVNIVQQLGHKMPNGIIRIDLYAGEKDIYFSEFTFTSNGCRFYYEPLVADAFLYGALYGYFTPRQLTPSFVEEAINQRFWYVVPLLHHTNPKDNKTYNAVTDMSTISGHPNDWTTCRRAKWHNTHNSTEQCFGMVTNMDQNYPIRCLGVTTDDLFVIGQWRIPSVLAAWERIDWEWGMFIGAIVVLLYVSGLGKEEKDTQLSVVVGYLTAVMIYKYSHPNNMGMFAPESLRATIVNSYHAFVLVHPMESQLIAFFHVATYWFEIAAWRSRTARGVLFWYFMYEIVTAFVNEYSHLTEAERPVRCLRVTFIHAAKQYAFNDMLRAYLLPPFFVYVYLLPKMVFQWVPFLNI
jgi:hypothetical protein